MNVLEVMMRPVISSTAVMRGSCPMAREGYLRQIHHAGVLLITVAPTAAECQN